ncbi:MAG: riboflavin kinase, partial [bacterium]
LKYEWLERCYELGRPFALAGRRVAGRRLGRAIGFPTINLVPRNEMLPRNGVYAVRLPALRLGGVANLGLRPTVEWTTVAPRLEVHAFGRVPSRLPARLDVEFIRFLRPELKFASVELLRRRIVRDAALARRVLSSRY